MIDSENFHIIRNENRIGATENMYNALMTIPMEENDILIRIDGDDYFLGPFVFQIVNEKYNQGSFLMTYGQEIIVDGCLKPTYRSPYTKEEFDNLRKIEWKMPPLRTFKYKLFTELIQQDPEVKCLKFNGREEFYVFSSDVALMYPLMEIAGFENIGMINNVLYCYRYHSNNDHETIDGRKIQFQTELDIRAGKPFRQVFNNFHLNY